MPLLRTTIGRRAFGRGDCAGPLLRTCHALQANRVACPHKYGRLACRNATVVDKQTADRRRHSAPAERIIRGTWWRALFSHAFPGRRNSSPCVYIIGDDGQSATPHCLPRTSWLPHCRPRAAACVRAARVPRRRVECETLIESTRGESVIAHVSAVVAMPSSRAIR